MSKSDEQFVSYVVTKLLNALRIEQVLECVGWLKTYISRIRQKFPVLRYGIESRFSHINVASSTMQIWQKMTIWYVTTRLHNRTDYEKTGDFKFCQFCRELHDISSVGFWEVTPFSNIYQANIVSLLVHFHWNIVLFKFNESFG